MSPAGAFCPLLIPVPKYLNRRKSVRGNRTNSSVHPGGLDESARQPYADHALCGGKHPSGPTVGTRSVALLRDPLGGRSHASPSKFDFFAKIFLAYAVKTVYNLAELSW